ncbi:MAG: hypothetical protein JXD18_00100 [Anaerolineae bacterium]|nr:hypothetical protein [Anaerolineae bacterium]
MTSIPKIAYVFAPAGAVTRRWRGFTTRTERAPRWKRDLYFRSLVAGNLPDAVASESRPTPNRYAFGGRPGAMCLLLFVLVLLLTGCGAQEALPTPTPLPGATATTTPPPSPTPTPTPLPPVPLTIHWPTLVTALEDARVSVDLPGLPARDPDAGLWVWVTDPQQHLVWTSYLEPEGEGTFVSSESFHLPMDAPAGEWHLNLRITSHVPVSGERSLAFRTESLPVWDLTGQVPAGVRLTVPQALALVQQEGDAVSGSRVWTYGDAAVELWWLPGPAEELTWDLALVALEATFPPGEAGSVAVSNAVATDWPWGAGFLVTESWPVGAAETQVVQAADHWLVLFRVRTASGSVPPLFEEILASFSLTEP